MLWQIGINSGKYMDIDSGMYKDCLGQNVRENSSISRKIISFYS